MTDTALLRRNLLPDGLSQISENIPSQNTINTNKLLLEALDVTPAKLKSLFPRSKRVHYRAIVNWLTQYRPSPDAPLFDQLRGCLEAFHHLCELHEWERAAKLINRTVVYKPRNLPAHLEENVETSNQLHKQLGIFGYYPEQIALYQRLLGKVSPEMEGICLNGIGLAYHTLGNPHKASEFHQKRLSLAQESHDSEGQMNALSNLGNTYSSLGEYQTASEAYQQALTLARELALKKDEGQILGNLGILARLTRLSKKSPKGIFHQLCFIFSSFLNTLP